MALPIQNNPQPIQSPTNLYMQSLPGTVPPGGLPQQTNLMSVGDALAAPPGGVGQQAPLGTPGAGGAGLTWGDALAVLNLVKRPPTPPPSPVVAGNPTSRPAPLALPIPPTAPGGLGQFLR